MNSNHINFSLSEEAFLLNSLQEVTKVWARASGKASFNLSVQDGQAHLQLGFQLGLPTEYHLPPSKTPLPKQNESVRKERNRKRAAEHQARLHASQTSKSEEAVSASTESLSKVTTSTPIIAAPAGTKSTTTAPVVPISSPSTSTPAIPVTAAPAVAISSIAAAPATVDSTVTLTSPTTAAVPTASAQPSVKTLQKPKFPPILPCRPVRPFCPPDKMNPLSQLPSFLEDLRFKVHVNAPKDFKVKHAELVKTFRNEMKEKPQIIFKSDNYEQTFLDFCEDSDKPLYERIFEHLPIK